MSISVLFFNSFFFFNDTATTEIYTLSLHDALPISSGRSTARWKNWPRVSKRRSSPCADRKSTRLNSSHSQISYAVFCLKKKKIMYSHHPASNRESHRDKAHDASYYTDSSCT